MSKLNWICLSLLFFVITCGRLREDSAEVKQGLESTVGTELILGPTGCGGTETSTDTPDAGTVTSTSGEDGEGGRCWNSTFCIGSDYSDNSACRTCLNGSAGLKSWRATGSTTCIMNQSACP